MSAIDALKEQDVGRALKELFDEVRAQPDQARHRVFLFQLLCVAGEWDRALTQLNVASDLDAETEIMATAYQEILQCEALRRDVFAGKRSPLLFGEPQAWMAQMIEALRLDGEGKNDAAIELRQQAFEAAPTTAGQLTHAAPDASGEPLEQAVDFDWIADGDCRLGPVMEMIVNGRYYWAPLDNIAEVTIESPADLRDVVWTPAQFRWSNDGEAVGVIPTRYVGSESQEDDQLRLSRGTAWQPTSDENAYIGLGQRTLITAEGEYGLMDIRKISFGDAAQAEA